MLVLLITCPSDTATLNGAQSKGSPCASGLYTLTQHYNIGVYVSCWKVCPEGMGFNCYVSPFTDFPECDTANSFSPPLSTLSYLYRGVPFLGSLSFSVRYELVVKDSSSVEIPGIEQSCVFSRLHFHLASPILCPRRLTVSDCQPGFFVFPIAFGLCQWDIFVGNQIIRQIAQTICSVILSFLGQ